MKMSMRTISLALALTASLTSFSQGAHSFKISEVCFADSISGFEDEYGDKSCWIEITNTSYGTHNIGSCYLTNNKEALNEELSVPERIKLMSLIPMGDSRTNLKAQERIVFYMDGRVNRGTLHTSFTLNPEQDNFIALFDGNAKTLLDTLTIARGTLKPGQSLALVKNTDNDGNVSSVWKVMEKDAVTPGEPSLGESVNDKVSQWKEKDPNGIAMTIVAMGIVMGCLALLYIFFHVFGWSISRMNKLSRLKAIQKIHDEASKVTTIAKQGLETQGIEYENYVAAIGFALHEYFGGTHDIESGIITIEQHHTAWNDESRAMTQNPVYDYLPETNIPINHSDVQ